MAWLLLIVAGVLEVVFASSLKPAEGFTRFWPSAAVVVFGTAAVVVLTRSLSQIPVSTAYAVFTGIGAVGTTLVAAAAFGESLTVPRLACIALVVAGIQRPLGHLAGVARRPLAAEVDTLDRRGRLGARLGLRRGGWPGGCARRCRSDTRSRGRRCRRRWGAGSRRAGRRPP